MLADLDLGKEINLDDLISRTYELEQINEGFALMLAGEVSRGVIVFD
jgi:Zn-dependent alcohol dehydrogenase